VLHTDGVSVFSAASGLSFGSPSAWTAATTQRLSAQDADMSNTFFKPTVVEIPATKDHLEAFILSKFKSNFENSFNY
jgi:hypothetical protein